MIYGMALVMPAFAINERKSFPEILYTENSGSDEGSAYDDEIIGQCFVALFIPSRCLEPELRNDKMTSITLRTLLLPPEDPL